MRFRTPGQVFQSGPEPFHRQEANWLHIGIRGPRVFVVDPMSHNPPGRFANGHALGMYNSPGGPIDRFRR